MQRVVRAVMVGMVVGLGAAGAWASNEHEHGHGAAHEPVAAAVGAGEQTLTGEVVDVLCYLSHGKDGLGKGHASCAKKCISGGLPVALKVGDQLYLAAMADHTPANQPLVARAGEQVTVRGKLIEQDGQRLIVISRIEPN